MAVPAKTPSNVTVDDPCAVPKLVPVMVTVVPTAPVAGERLATIGTNPLTVKVASLLTMPLEFATTIGPEVAPFGTGTTILFATQLDGLPAIPLKRTAPSTVPKCAPLIVTVAPTAPLPGEVVVIFG
jgi:hypothetical protein